jgi:hypothetical protein
MSHSFEPAIVAEASTISEGEEKTQSCEATEIIMRPKKPMRRVFISSLVLLCGFGTVAGFRGLYAAPIHRTEFGSGASCIEQYNAKLVEAKSALISGDRTHALNALVAAKEQLGRCEEREEESATHAVGVSLNLFDAGDFSGLV